MIYALLYVEQYFYFVKRETRFMFKSRREFTYSARRKTAFDQVTKNISLEK